MQIRFDMVDSDTVDYLSNGDRNLLPQKIVDGKKEYRWDKQKITSTVMQGIMNGDGIDVMSESFSKVLGMGENSAILNARTSVTSAQNKGRQDSFNKLADMGVDVWKQWMATGDSRTRDSHLMLNGEKVKYNKAFSNDCQYPADPDGAPEEVYNCRCTMVINLPDSDSDIVQEMQDEIGVAKEIQRRGGTVGKNRGHVVAQGTDISLTWERRDQEFDFEIEDVINAQGFDGVPRVVGEAEFNELVKESGFIAQRTYSAESQEILDSYRDQLYNGKWYVDCGAGGAQYGQGMYCAANYDGELTDGIKSEMQHYIELGKTRMEQIDYTQVIADAREKEAKNIYDEIIKSATDKMSEGERLMFRNDKLSEQLNKEEFNLYIKTMKGMTPDERAKQRSAFNNIIEEAKSESQKINDISIDEYAKTRGLQLKVEPQAYIETLTLAKDAKIITYDELRNQYAEYDKKYIGDYEVLKDKATNTIIDELNLPTRKTVSDYKTMLNLYSTATTNSGFRKLDELQTQYGVDISEIYHKITDEAARLRTEQKKRTIQNLGSYAASIGYDAINAEGHGDSGSYTVILNRTKVIFKEDKNGPIKAQ